MRLLKQLNKLGRSVCLLFMIGLSSCSLNNFLQVEEKIELNATQIAIFTDLLDKGWKIKLYKNKIILVKYKKDQTLVYDIFNLLEK